MPGMEIATEFQDRSIFQLAKKKKSISKLLLSVGGTVAM